MVTLVFMPQLGLDRSFTARPRLDFDAGEPNVRIKDQTVMSVSPLARFFIFQGDFLCMLFSFGTSFWFIDLTCLCVRLCVCANVHRSTQNVLKTH